MMNRRSIGWRLALALSLGVAAQAASADGFEQLSRVGEEVLEDCGSENLSECQLESLPGEPDFTLLDERRVGIVLNGVRVGSVFERVWQSTSDATVYILGTKVAVNTSVWDESGASFNINDVFRRALPGRYAGVAYVQDDALKPLLAAGRTLQGVGEYVEEEPERDNSWVAFRVDVNAADPDGVSSRTSPWLLLKTRAPRGLERDPFAIRVLNSAVDEFGEPVAVFTPGYQPVGLPEPPDDDDEAQARRTAR